ncbi:hypothetical protein ACH47Z_44280, partial [Streptomyces sp. NPDC020192]|uniref:hypothetical protein n=1 Tax=Streptomyces sp. NPDC020192 TaxID=3365066 RepID=UPI0037A780C3
PLEQLPQLVRHQPLNDSHANRLPNTPNEMTSKAGAMDVQGYSSAKQAGLGGTLVLSRARGGYRYAVRGYAVLLDHAQVGSIRRGQTLRFEVPSGVHRLQLKIAWCSSPPLTAVVKPGSTVYFCCTPGDGSFDGLDDVLGNPGNYIALQRTPEPAAMDKIRLAWSGRVLMGASLGLLAGGITVIVALVWHLLNPVASASLAVMLLSGIVAQCGRRYRTRRRRCR